jgi:hypothetical protein
MCSVQYSFTIQNIFLRQENLTEETSFGLKLKYYTYMVYYSIPFIRFKDKECTVDKTKSSG